MSNAENSESEFSLNNPDINRLEHKQEAEELVAVQAIIAVAAALIGIYN